MKTLKSRAVERGKLIRSSLVALLLVLVACGGSGIDTTTPTTVAGTPTTEPANDTTAPPATSATTTAAPAELGELSYQLGWLMNIQYGGTLIADAEGYYMDEGFTAVELLPGGPDTAPVPVVVSGNALVGMTSFPALAGALAEGAEIRAIGVKFQRNPSGLMSLATNPVLTPEDIVGKRVGVCGSCVPGWEAFLAVNGIDPSEVTTVPVQFDPQPLVNGEVDAWYSFITSQPNALRARGIEVEVMAFHDYGMETVAEAYFTTLENLSGKRAELKAFMAAEIRGWQEAVQNPEKAARLAVEEYGADLGLDLDEQLLEANDQNELLVATPEALDHGYAYVSPEQQEQTVAILESSAGMTVSAQDLFDMSILDELFAERPELAEFTR